MYPRLDGKKSPLQFRDYEHVSKSMLIEPSEHLKMSRSVYDGQSSESAKDDPDVG